MLDKLKELEFIDARKTIKVKFNGLTLASISKSQLELLFKSLLGMNESLTEIDKKAFILSKDYNKLKQAYYSKQIRVTNYTKNHKDFKYFVEATKLIDMLDTTNAKFLKAQVDGLKFINNNIGRFPTPAQIASEKAQDRLLLYLQDLGEINTSGFTDNDLTKVNGKITLNKHDYETPLSQNTKYRNLLSKLRNGSATLDEASYLKLCRLHRKGDIGNEIKKYIIKLKGDTKK